MHLIKEEFATQLDLMNRAIKLCRQAVDDGKTAWLVTTTPDQAEVFKRIIAQHVKAGVNVEAYSHWLGELWDAYGDGTKLINATKRKIFARVFLTEIIKRDPSASYIDDLASFLSDAVGEVSHTSAGFSDLELEVMDYVALYKKTLDDNSVVEEVHVERGLPQEAFSGSVVIFVDLDITSAHRLQAVEHFGECTTAYDLRRTIAAHAKLCADVCGTGTGAGAGIGVGSSELHNLYAALYSGKGGLQAGGNVILGEAYGSHCAQDLCVQLIQNLMARGVRTRDIVIVEDDASKIDYKFFEAFVAAGIPFSVNISMPLMNTKFGAAYITLCKIRSTLRLLAMDSDMFIPSEQLYEETISLVSSPYFGLSNSKARSLQKNWRMKGGSNFFERINDIFEYTDLLKPETSDEDCARKMFENVSAAKRAKLDSELLYSDKFECMLQESLFDDAACVEAILDYLEECAEVGIYDYDELLANVPVKLTRASGNLEDAIAICSSDALFYTKVDNLIMANLESDAFKMSAGVTPFDMLREKLGILFEQNKPDQQRLKLLTLVENTRNNFVAYRLCHNGIGDEICPSALWEELLTPYRSDEENKSGMDVQKVPSTFDENGLVLRVCEADIFNNYDADDHTMVDILRAKLERAESLDILLPDFENYGELFSPTALEALYRCPYRWFINNRIGVKIMDVGFEATDMGNLAHDTLHAFYQKWLSNGNERVVEDNLDEALEMLVDIFNECLDESTAKGEFVIKSAFDTVQCEKIRAQLMNLICRDANFLPKFKPKYLELKLTGDDENGPLMYAGVAVSGKVDRIDVNEEGEAVIIDYKMSTLGAGRGYGVGREQDFPARIQTDIYASMVQQYFDRKGIDIKIVGSVYRSYATNCMRGAYDAKVDFGEYEFLYPCDELPNENHAVKYSEYVERVEGLVKKCLDSLKEGNIPAHPLVKDACEYCHAKNFCGKRAQ